MIKKIEVFLGGTCADGTTWREKIIPLLEVDYFNPVVDDWNEEAYKKELEKRETCDYVLYVITPMMEGCYSIAEVVDDSNKRPKKTIFCVLKYDGEVEDPKTWSKNMEKSLTAVKKMVKNNGGEVFDHLFEVANYLNNNKYIEKK